MTTVRLPAISTEHASAFVSTHYGINAHLSPLNGERDLNFLVDPVGRESPESRYVFKVANQDESREVLEAQIRVFELLSEDDALKSIVSVPASTGSHIELISDPEGNQHLCRLTTYLEGELLSATTPRSSALYQSLGVTVARTGIALQRLATPIPAQELLWDMRQAENLINRFLPLVTAPERHQLIRRFLVRFGQDLGSAEGSLRTGLIHNDANDNNVVVVDGEHGQQRVAGLIDFGDMMEGWRVADLAIACAYAMLDQPRPLDVAAEIVRGFHRADTLSDAEFRCLFAMISMRLCMSVCIAVHQQQLDPNNPYLSVSEGPAWRLLEELARIPGRYPEYLFRSVCGLEAVPVVPGIVSWLDHIPGTPRSVASPVNLELSTAPLMVFDTSVSSPEVSPLDLIDHEGNLDTTSMARRVVRAMEDAGAVAAIGRYDEYRLIYNTDDFVDFTGHQRTLHLGVDIYQPAGSPVYTILAGTVYSVANHAEALDYGGTVLVSHVADGNTFYILYGHLDPASISMLGAGDTVEAGQQIGTMGGPEANGGWPPHLHIEIVTDLLGYSDTFVGVGSHAHRAVWRSLCPNPSKLLRLPESLTQASQSDSCRDPQLMVSQRARYLSQALSTSYQEPILLGRGLGQYLYDFTGRRYLDAVNNVPHVGHCHPDVVKAGAQAAGVLSTNTRYLYPSLTRYASRLLGTFDPHLEVVFLVNSGSEANDLALRLAKRYTGRKNVTVLDHAYHGNLGSLVDMSPYKHNGRGGEGPPDWVYTVPLPDKLRQGAGLGDDEFLSRCLSEADQVVTAAEPVAALFAEPISGCGGQVVLPAGYLEGIFELVRDRGGVCVADEVQTGFGRVGSHFWAHQAQHAVPDIVTLGKPSGNGHPLAAVVTTRAIADAFVTGMEYFNTFGGNPVSCAIGEAVLDVIEREGLQHNALSTGEYLMDKLRGLAHQHPLIAEVRGAGLFIGMELTEGGQSMDPAPRQAAYIAERMKQEGVLISTDGPHHNVLKIKPPLVFNHQNADFLVFKLTEVLNEKWALPRPF